MRLLSLLLILSAFIGIPGPSAAESQTTVEPAGPHQAGKTLRVCIWPDYYGISFRNPKNNQLSGIDVDMARELARDLGPGVQVQFIDSSFGQLIDDITADRCIYCHVAASASPTSGRKNNYHTPTCKAISTPSPPAVTAASSTGPTSISRVWWWRWQGYPVRTLDAPETATGATFGTRYPFCP